MALMMPEISIETETETTRGWDFAVTVFDQGRKHDYAVQLSWADYDHWSHGRVAPEKVVYAAFEFLLEREPATAIMSRFDASVIRRYFSEVDEVLPTMF